MLLTSPEVVKYYSSKYSKRASLIASSMAGKEIIRKPHLVLLGTTSLYGLVQANITESRYLLKN
jgi:hypothetical protein